MLLTIKFSKYLPFIKTFLKITITEISKSRFNSQKNVRFSKLFSIDKFINNFKLIILRKNSCIYQFKHHTLLSITLKVIFVNPES